MQSGISASDELHSAFKTLISDSSQRALLASIESESLVPKSTVPATADFYSDLRQFASVLKPNEACYILLRLPNASASSPFAAVTYVPDAAPVRQKMLFASTRLTLARELGNESFAESVFCTTAAEMSPEGWKRHEAHGEAEKPLTQEERDLVDIREAEAIEAGGTGRRGAGYGGGTGGRPVEAGGGVLDALKQLKDGDLVMLKIASDESIVLADASKPVVFSVVPADLASHIDASEPRYSYYKHSYSTANGDESAVIFIYTCPSATKVRDRMLYASSRRSAEALAEKEAGISLAKRLEATDPTEITAQTIESEFTPKQEQRAGFAKPKRPGRR